MSPATAGRKKRTVAVSALRQREPEVLKVIGEESVRNGTSKLTLRQINRIIKASRSEKLKR